MMNKSSWFLIIAAVYGLTAVVLGAMGQHLLGITTGSKEAMLFQHAYTYQLIHALLLIWVANNLEQGFWVRSAGYALCLGVLLFCGGLYLLLLVGKTAVSWVTPVGGSLLILAWLNLVVHGFKKLSNHSR